MLAPKSAGHDVGEFYKETDDPDPLLEAVRELMASVAEWTPRRNGRYIEAFANVRALLGDE